MAVLEESNLELYCICRKPYKDDEFMIECNVCKDWFHGRCVGIEEYESNDIDLYHCPRCRPEHGPLTLKRRRNWHRHDYSEINDGSKAVQSGTVVFINKLKKKNFPSADEIMTHLHGNDLTVEWFETHGFNRPLMVDQPEGLGLIVPSPEFTVADVETYVGPMRELDAIDVACQGDIKMRMREWVEYYQSKPRKKVLNVISLEFSDTPLNKLVEPPSVVREIDWINRHWPENLSSDSPFKKPQVQKYCLMGVKDCYTDFHVDFGGTSVWYHVIKGEKVFYLIPPSDENLLRYEEWVLSSNQSEVYFGSLVPECYCCHVLPGNTLFIPTGWIHAVLTPEDSLVFGGNFLHRFNMGLQLRIYEMELRLSTPLKFLHPCYEALTWYAARDYLRQLRGYGADITPSKYLLKGVEAMCLFLQDWTNNSRTNKAHKYEIPPEIDPTSLLRQLRKTIKDFLEVERPAEDISGDGGGGEDPKQRSIRLRFSHGQLTRHEKDGDIERITMKLSVPQAKKLKKEPQEKSLKKPKKTYEMISEDEQYSDEELHDAEYVYSKMVSGDDAGALVDDKEDRLWTPGSRSPKQDTKPDKRSWAQSSDDEKAVLMKKSKTTVLGSSKPRPKPKTAKQRLGKILGLDRTGRFMKK